MSDDAVFINNEVGWQTEAEAIAANNELTDEELRQRLDGMEQKIQELTGAVNQFGAMLDHVVQTVVGFASKFSGAGLAGMFGGKQ